MEDFKTYMSFIDAESSLELTELLKKNDIAFQLLDTQADFDPSMAFNEANKPFIVQILAENFDKANNLLQEQNSLHDMHQEHFLYQFTDDELIGVLKNEEEWYPLDVILAKELLKKRNVSYSENEITAYQDAKKAKGYQPEKLPKYTLPIAYLICLFGGLLGVAIALYIISSKKKLPSDEKIFSYSTPDRNHAKLMLVLALVYSFIFFKYLI